jgi:hypothetical protein
MVRRSNSLKRNCFDIALKLMFKYDTPTDEQIYHHMCTSNNCPEEHCTYMFGFKEGRDCGHVGSVKKIIKNLISFRDDE